MSMAAYRRDSVTRPATAALALVAAATLALPNVASAATRSCSRFVPGPNVPETASAGSRDAALSAPVVRVTDDATAEAPIVLEYEHGMAYGIPILADIVEEEKFFNFQVVTNRKSPGLHIRAEWPITSPTDIDLYLHDDEGAQVAYSDAWNVPGLDDVSDVVFYEGHGGLGYEYIEGFRATSCGGYTLMSETGRSPGTEVTLKVWLGPQSDHYDYE